MKLAKLVDSLPAGPFFRSFVHNLIAFCSRLEATSDIISGRFVSQIVPDKRVTFGDSRSNCSRDIRAAHFVMVDERRRRRTQVIT